MSATQFPERRLDTTAGGRVLLPLSTGFVTVSSHGVAT